MSRSLQGIALALLAGAGCAALAGLDKDYVEVAPSGDSGPEVTAETGPIDAGAESEAAPSACDAAGQAICGTECVDTRTSLAHCGTCDRPCARCERGACVGWEPTQLAGLEFWIRADRGITSAGGKVSVWADQSGKGRDAVQGLASRQPTLRSEVAGLNTQAAVEFDGVDDVLSTVTATNLSSGYELFSVVLVAAASPHTGVFRFAATAEGPSVISTVVLSLDAQNALHWGHDDDRASLSLWVSGPLSSAGASTFGVSNPGPLTQANVFHNGVSLQGTLRTPLDYAMPADPSQIHPGVGTAGGYLRGVIAEQIVYARTLSSVERVKVETYLRDRYKHY